MIVPAAAIRLALLAFSFAAAAHAQFELLLPNGTPVPGIYDLGRVYAGETATARFRLRNTSATAATLTSLGVGGLGFTLAGPSLPAGIAAQDGIDFTVTFRAAETGTYSAVLQANGIAVLLTAGVLPSLTYRVDTASGLVPLTTLDFGSVVRGSVAQRRIALRNETSVLLTVPPISIQGDGFSLAAAPPSGQVLQPQQGAEFTVVFHPLSAGARQGALAIGDRSYPVLGVGGELPLPRASLSINLQPAASGRQGTLVIRFDAPAQSSGAGTVTLDFSGLADPAIAFASGGRSATFIVAPGDSQAVLAFQTGTTSGTLTFTVQLGQATERQSVTIPAAPVTIAAVQSTRASGTIEIRVTGFDNTRSLGALAFTFSDGTGKLLATIRSDAAADFARFFAVTDLGGQFVLRAVFPVTGDSASVASCEVGLTNSAGTAVQRVLLP